MAESRLKEYIDINPTVKLQKGKVYSLVEMEKITVGKKRADTNSKAEYTGKSCSKFLPNDTLMARITPCLENGKIAKYESDTAGFGSTEFFILRAKKEKTTADYVYYLSQTHYVRQLAVNSMTGASGRQRADAKFIGNIKWDFPELGIQSKVADILSTYDDLIENNNKRIKLLEQMAENLYKEWFVRFRFPGYENVEFDGTLPSGWQYQLISESMDFFDSQRVPLSSMQRDEMEKIYPYYGAAKLMDYVDDYLFDGEYLLLGEDGTVVTTDGFPVLQLANDKFWVNNHAHVIRGKGNISTRFLYLMFCRFPITSVVTGSAQPKISKGRLEKRKILVPDAMTMEHFNNLINPMFDEINVLKKQVIRIAKQRDMLLPRLMSGRLEV